MIQVHDINKSFTQGKEQQHVLNDISFHLKKGEIVTLLGESGCGKSTLLHTIGGFVQADSGEVYIADELVTKPNRSCITLFQQHNLLPWRNVLDNVLLGLTGSKKENKQNALDVLTFVGLEKYIDRFPHELSGGMQQRVAIARAFALEPSVILMDEPFAALDTFNRYHLQDELINMQNQRETSILLVTHDIDEAIFLSDRIIILSANPGQIYETVNISLTKPRDRSSEQFNNYRKSILQTFKLSSEVAKLEYYI
ncbi:MAG TPA: ABC transporter ATP-binding protein [Pseudogracilibacillus sp.]|nr:ABC transporter ATP-binding protein [Pseudogracilibacillus sp.]